MSYPGLNLQCATVTKEVDVPCVTIRRGQYLTVYLDDGKDAPVQVELHVTADRIARVLLPKLNLCEGGRISVVSFEEIYK